MNFNLKNLSEASIAKVYLDKLIEKGSRCEIIKVPENRTPKQGAYVHVLIRIFAVYFGYEDDEAKIVIKNDLGYIYEKNGKKFLRSTKDFTKEEMMDFIDKLIKYSAEQGLPLPSAEEYKDNPARYEEFIRVNSYKG